MVQDAGLLTFELIDTDPDWPGFTVTARSGAFSGSTDIWLSRADALGFTRELAHFDRLLQGEVRLRAGFGNEPSLVLVVRPYGHSGRLSVEAEVTDNVGGENCHMVRLFFVLPEPGLLTRFRSEFEDLLAGNRTEPACLSSAFAPAA